MRNQAKFDLFYDNGCDKQLVISEVNGAFVITDDEIVSQEMVLSENLNSDVQLVVGSCESSSFEFQTTNTTSALIGRTVNVDFVLDGDTTNPVRLGTYKIDKATLSSDKSKRDVIAYDLMYDIINADVTDWYESLNFSNLTLRQFRNAFFTHLGIAQQLVGLVNDNMRVYKTVKSTTLSGKDVITAICEINGVFGHINAQNEFVYVQLANGSKVGDITPNIYTDLEYQDYKVKRIDSVQIRQETNDVGVVVDSGSRDNTLIVQSNFLVYGLDQASLTTIATNLLNHVYLYNEYIPFSTTTIGNPCYEVGDIVQIDDVSGNTFETVILGRTLKGIKSLWDVLNADGTEYREEKVNGIESEYERLRGRYMLLDKSIDGINVTIGDDNRGLIHDVKANASGLSAEITQREVLGDRVTNVEIGAGNLELRMESFEKQLEGEYTSYDVVERPDIDAYGKDKPNAPSDGWCTNIYVRETNPLKFDDYPNGVIPFIYTEDDYKRNLRAMAFDMESLQAYRFRFNNGQYLWEDIPDTEMKLLLEKITEIKASTDELSVKVAENAKSLEDKATISEVETKISVSADAIKTDISGTYYDKNAIDGKGYVTKGNKSYSTIDGILQEVSQKYVANDATYTSMKTTVSQTASAITGKASKTDGQKGSQSFGYELTADHFLLSANSTDVFNCTKDGITMKNASNSNQLTVNSNGIYIKGSCDITGKVSATSGYIGNGSNGFTISSTSIYNGKSGRDDANNGIYIGTNGIALGANNAFYVTNGGKLYAKNVELTGKITATSGFIGSANDGFTLTSNAFYKGTNSMTSTTDGIYISTSGIRLVSPSTDLTISSGRIYCSGFTDKESDSVTIFNGRISGTRVDSTKMYCDEIRPKSVSKVQIHNGLLTDSSGTEVSCTQTKIGYYDYFFRCGSTNIASFNKDAFKIEERLDIPYTSRMRVYLDSTNSTNYIEVGGKTIRFNTYFNDGTFEVQDKNGNNLIGFNSGSVAIGESQGKLGFYGKTPQSRQGVDGKLLSSASLTATINKVNVLIDVLIKYGLINLV